MDIRMNDKTWVVCTKCGTGIDMSKGGTCKCSNIQVTVARNGIAGVTAHDSDAVVYDNDK